MKNNNEYAVLFFVLALLAVLVIGLSKYRSDQCQGEIGTVASKEFVPAHEESQFSYFITVGKVLVPIYKTVRVDDGWYVSAVYDKSICNATYRVDEVLYDSYAVGDVFP